MEFATEAKRDYLGIEYTTLSISLLMQVNEAFHTGQQFEKPGPLNAFQHPNKKS